MPTKKYSKNRETCRVTFGIPKEVDAATAHLCGDFNAWSRTSHPMKRGKDGSFKLALSVPSNQRYGYRFLLDDVRWENDWQGESYEPNPYGSENSVIEV